MIGIYKIENKITNEIYIGQSRNISQRWTSHKNPKNWTYGKLYKAFLEYGLDNFEFTVLKECELEDLNRLEIEYIEKFDTINQGYNTMKGGHKVREENPSYYWRKAVSPNVVMAYDYLKNKWDAKTQEKVDFSITDLSLHIFNSPDIRLTKLALYTLRCFGLIRYRIIVKEIDGVISRQYQLLDLQDTDRVLFSTLS